jgi:hypothetical protein
MFYLMNREPGFQALNTSQNSARFATEPMSAPVNPGEGSTPPKGGDFSNGITGIFAPTPTSASIGRDNSLAKR